MCPGNFVNFAVCISRMREELAGLADSRKTMTAEEKKNTEKFLALTLPPKHNAGMKPSLFLWDNSVAVFASDN